MAPLHVGTSGWNYAHWRVVFYPPGLPPSKWLAHYASVFDCVEVNATFYRLPVPGSVARWAQTVAPGFRFAVKGSRYLTHMRRLLDRERGVRRFFDAIEPFGAARGPILWQLPPNFRADFGRLRAFLKALPPGPHAVEVRSADWLQEELFVLVEDLGAALVVHDLLDGPWPWPPPGPFVYRRFHGAGQQMPLYGSRKLRRHAKALERLRVEGWVFFNNDQAGAAIADALELRRLLGLQRTATTARSASAVAGLNTSPTQGSGR